MKVLIVALLITGCAVDGIPAGAADLAVAPDLANRVSFCTRDTCAIDQYCVELCPGVQCIPTPPRCAPLSAAVTSCACLDSDPCRATQPCFNILPGERKVRCICE
jgi:hypothetical protein